MFLRSLTLKGFKSFAEKTALDFEPGVTVVVGPNGSGKSNLVDAVAWVLGAQGARALRGSKMDDVIFAGTAQRPALGRAEVSLTIDNSAGLLPIEFTEVTVTRTLFRSGESEYAINGAPCRLLDIQELLSDTGIGRQQHVIVGQGQIDAVLNSRPEERRAVVEEAAGILKYRKRREKAERRLEATEGNLLRLSDTLREVRRQLGPLQRQADAARRHDGLVEELRAIRVYLAGHEIAGLQTRLDRLHARRTELRACDEAARAELARLDVEVLEAERELTIGGDDASGDALVRIEALRERARGLGALAQEKRRGIERELVAAADEGVVDTLVADADGLRLALGELHPEAGEPAGGDDAEVARCRAERADAERALEAAEQVLNAAERELGHWRARADALGATLESVRLAAGAEQLATVPGVVGLLAEHLQVEAGAEAAVSAALGEAAHAVVVRDGEAARAAFERLAGDDDAHALLLVLGDRATLPQYPLAPAGTRPLAELVRTSLPGLDLALSHLLADAVLVEGDWREALRVALAHPGLVAVTRRGDRCGGRGPWSAGGGRGGGATRAALDEALERARAAEVARAEAHGSLEAPRARLARAIAAERAAEQARAEHGARRAAAAERRRVLAERLADVEARLARHPEAHAEAERRRRVLRERTAALTAVQERLEATRARIDAVHARLQERRRRESEVAQAAGRRLEELRGARAGLERELAEVRELEGRTDVERAEVRTRLEAAVEKLRADHDCEPAAALDAPAPEVPEGTTAAGRARELERELRLLGPVNPLALEEYDALVERHDFLQQQLADVKESRRELQRVIRAVDQEIQTTFATAFADVERHFAELFTTLFPGGSGRIFLTDPDNLLDTGIEIEARPSGKNTKRLSLLSGGERSLTAMAFLFGVFRARPSPFYLLDEVEAALDDVNLHRFLDLVHEFRDEAQLLIVSHQKRTMEAADCLYGVSMPPGGSSRVVSQRITARDDELVLD